MRDPIYTCKDKSGEQLRVISKPFYDEDKTYVVTKDKNSVFQIKILKNLIFEGGTPGSLLEFEPIMHETLFPEPEPERSMKVLKVILEVERGFTIGEASYEALKYAINNQCNVEFEYSAKMYRVVFNDIFLACKEVK